jgi:hypothetical protein
LPLPPLLLPIGEVADDPSVEMLMGAGGADAGGSAHVSDTAVAKKTRGKKKR